jgi:hypothetical protein
MRRLTVLAAGLVVSCGVALAGSSVSSPRFSLSTASAVPGDRIEVRLTSAPRPFRRRLRLYLLSTQFVGDVRSASDLRLYSLGSFTPKSRRLRVTVPSFAAGTYLLAWCRACGSTPLGVVRAPTLRLEAPPESNSCAVTRPNGVAPDGVQPAGSFYGNANLAVGIPADGILRSRDPDGKLFEKMVWVGDSFQGTLRVAYRRLEVSAPAIRAVTVAGTLGGYNGPSWASRMYFDRGCWEITGRVGDASLRLVVAVARS